MADQSDVEAALVGLAATALYPNGTGAASATGGVVHLYRGWPSNAALEADLAAGGAHVSVVKVSGGSESAASFPTVWEYPRAISPVLTVDVTEDQVTFGGSALPGQLAGLLIDGAAFVYRTRVGDTTAAVAANLAVQVSQLRAATVADASITVPGAMRFIARITADQPALMQTRRQRQVFRLSCWCADPATRDKLGGAIDAAFAVVPFVSLADGSVGRLLPSRSDVADELSTLPLYRRDLFYNVEYATTIVQTQPSMIFGLFGVGGADDALRIS